MTACFIGHKKVEKKERVAFSVKETVEMLIKKGVKTFFFGSMSEFDCLSREVVAKLKMQYPYIKRVYVRSAFQYIDKAYEEYLLAFYEETYFPPKIEKAGKASYVERNCEMIDKSTYCVFYYNENYVPPFKRRSESTPRNSGTKIAYEYALKKKKIIINVYRGQ